MLPIALIAQTNIVPGTGKYAVEAGANSYATQINESVDIFSVNRTGVNFDLRK